MEILGVKNPKEETDTSIIPGNPQGPTPINDNNTPKLKTLKPVPIQHDPNNTMTKNYGDDTNKEDKNEK